MTNTANNTIDIIDYMLRLGIDPVLCKYVANNSQLKREIMYELRHNLKPISSKSIIIRVLNRYLPASYKKTQKKI